MSSLNEIDFDAFGTELVDVLNRIANNLNRIALNLEENSSAGFFDVKTYEP